MDGAHHLNELSLGLHVQTDVQTETDTRVMLYAFPRNQHNKNKDIRAFRPLEVCGAVFGDAVVDGAHHLNELSLGLVLADDLVLAEEVRRDGDERVLGPALEPVHRAAGYQAGELQRTVPELLADLSQQAVNVIRQKAASPRALSRGSGPHLIHGSLGQHQSL